jgi:hypothetical protein
MKLNPIQVAASATGAVAAAVIASYFGVKGTIIGTAMGSVVATTSAALVGHWIERTHKAVRQVVVKNADQVPFLRHGSQTRPAGEVAASHAETSVGSSLEHPGVAGTADGAAGTGAPGGAADGAAGTGAPGGAADDRARGSREGAVGPRRLLASSGGSRHGALATTTTTTAATPGPDAARRRWRFSWRPLVLSVGLVFVVALGVVTVLELAAGRPLSSLVGATNASGGTSAGNLFTSTPAPSATTTTGPATTTTAAPATTTTTVPATTTTTTGPASTTTTAPATTTTTTTTQPATVAGTSATG